MPVVEEIAADTCSNISMQYENLTEEDVSDEEIELKDLEKRMWKDRIKLKRIKERQNVEAKQNTRVWYRPAHKKRQHAAPPLNTPQLMPDNNGVPVLSVNKNEKTTNAECSLSLGFGGEGNGENRNEIIKEYDFMTPFNSLSFDFGGGLNSDFGLPLDDMSLDEGMMQLFEYFGA